ncbi:MAG: hypothetical protein M0R40_00625 [Firmicutes bacterium]|nr:hypothetical protein [Bacillota bacterium]
MLIVVAVLSVIIIIQAILHWFERKDLYNRLMCRNMSEYKTINEPVSKSISAHQRVIEKWRKRQEK